ncbi:tetratricopeptide repeat protein [Pseudodesulfovibrio sp.]|nr:tetratricopeptide repeat protein [Pseudodesulfovibrio sp.]
MAKNDTPQDATLAEVESHVPEQLHPILEAAFKYQKQLVIGVAAIIAVTAIYAGLNAYNQNAMATAQNKLGTILIEASGDDKIAKLKTLLAVAPSAAKPAVLLELAQSSIINGDYDNAVSYWDQLAGEADDDLAFVARLGKAKALTLAGKGGEAVTELKDLAGIAPAAFTIPVYRQLAVAAELAGDTNEALAAYQKLAEQPVSDKPFIDFKVAQLSAQ